MKKEVKLVNKIKRLLKRLGCPRWLHHFGPKTYEFREHLQALMVKVYCQLSYGRIVKLFDLLGIRCPSKSALHYTMQRIQSWLWQRILKATAGDKHYIIAIDSTGFSRTNPSYHYLRRIDGKMPKAHVKLSAGFDTKLKKWCSAKVRIKPRHDIKDAKTLIKQNNPKIVVADKAYDADWLHRHCIKQGIKTCIPVRDYGKVRPRHTLRRKLAKEIRARTYHRREMIESGFGSIKRKFGASVSSKNARTIRAEVYGKLICHNLFFWFYRLLG